MENNEEIWKLIPFGYNYYISNLGNIMRVVDNKNIYYNPQMNVKNRYKKILICKKQYYLHQLVAIAFLNHETSNRSIVVDHINGNTIDNRLENLQIITHRQNISKQKPKTSNLRGVSWDKFRNKWKSQITINRKTKFLGRFDCQKEAHECYLIALSKIT